MRNPGGVSLNSKGIHGRSPETFEDTGQKAKERGKQWQVRKAENPQRVGCVAQEPPVQEGRAGSPQGPTKVHGHEHKVRLQPHLASRVEARRGSKLDLIMIGSTPETVIGGRG